MKKALFIPAIPGADGREIYEVEWNSMADIRDLIGCESVEQVFVGDYRDRDGFDDIAMLVDEDGVYKRLPVNPFAATLYGRPIHGNAIYGDALIVGYDWRDREKDWEALSPEHVIPRLSAIWASTPH